MKTTHKIAACCAAAGLLAYLGSAGGGSALLFALAAAGAAFAASAVARRETKKIERDVGTFARSLLSKQFPRYNPSGSEGSGEMAKALNDAAEVLKSRFEAADEQSVRFSAVLDEASEGVLCVSRAGRVTVANKAARVMLAAADDIIGRNYWEVVFSAELRKLIMDALESDGGSPLRREVTNLYPLESFYMASAAHTKKRREAVMVLFDLTEFKKLEAAQRDLITNISHEIRTPLTSIAGAAERIADRTRSDGGGGETAEKLALMIERNTRRLTDLCSRIITLSELEDMAQKGGREFKRLNLAEAAANAANLMKAAADGKNIEITVCGGGELQMDGDGLIIENMLVNLIENAVKYSPEGEKIKVSAGRDGNGDIKISVTDRGEGIGSEETGRIFERFYRAEKARPAQKGGGNGLGLSIARQAAEIHGGNISVESRPGSGSVFTVTFPRRG